MATVDSETQKHWSSVMEPETAVRVLLKLIGEDPDREGLRDTPKRVTKALCEMTAGLHQDPKSVLGTMFSETSDQMVIVRGIHFTSLCEHHLLPFVGTAVVGYIPNGRVVGLSKIPRLVNIFARRPQVQERMTNQIAEALQQYIDPLGVAVIVKAKHACMGCRGVRQTEAEMITSCLMGCLKTDSAARNELLQLM